MKDGKIIPLRNKILLLNRWYIQVQLWEIIYILCQKLNGGNLSQVLSSTANFNNSNVKREWMQQEKKITRQIFIGCCSTFNTRLEWILRSEINVSLLFLLRFKHFSTNKKLANSCKICYFNDNGFIIYCCAFGNHQMNERTKWTLQNVQKMNK